ncbi:MAG TPA: hypothetical protein VN366_07950 [Feifaniaceae bacterium]|nr:hypothetical protein [Feifaniaceae bacterium]
MRRKECIAVLKESPVPTGWMRAYISIYLIELFVAVAYFELRLLSPLFFGNFPPSSERFPHAVILAAFGLVLLVCTAFTYKYMIKLRPDGFIWGVVHLALSGLYWAVNAAINFGLMYYSEPSGYVLYAVVFFVIYTGVWSIPNYLYLKKRRELFRAYAPNEIAYAMGQWHSLS